MKPVLLVIAIAVSFFQMKAQDSSVFERIKKAVTEYKIDTSDAPKDKITEKIIELRRLKGGFNINEAIEFKIREDLEKNESSKETLLKLSESFNNGQGKKWLDNAVIRIYREEFSYKELKQLIKFYKTPAGRKMANDFPLIMLKSLAAAEIIQQVLIKK